MENEYYPEDIKKIPERFWFWLFEATADSDITSRYSSKNFHEEYGISCFEFAREYPNEAVLDAKDYFVRFPKETKQRYLNSWIDELDTEIDALEQSRIDANKILIDLFGEK